MLRKICNFLTTILILVLLVLAIVLIVPRLMGYQSLAVLSGSMEPEISVGSIVFIKETEPADLEVGDVITYRLSGNTLVTHRIIEKDEVVEQFITQGDASRKSDNAFAFPGVSFHLHKNTSWNCRDLWISGSIDSFGFSSGSVFFR